MISPVLGNAVQSTCPPPLPCFVKVLEGQRSRGKGREKSDGVAKLTFNKMLKHYTHTHPYRLKKCIKNQALLLSWGGGGGLAMRYYKANEVENTGECKS